MHGFTVPALIVLILIWMVEVSFSRKINHQFSRVQSLWSPPTFMSVVLVVPSSLPTYMCKTCVNLPTYLLLPNIMSFCKMRKCINAALMLLIIVYVTDCLTPLLHGQTQVGSVSMLIWVQPRFCVYTVCSQAVINLVY